MFRRNISAIALGNAADVHFRAAVDWLAGNVACRFFADAKSAIAKSALAVPGVRDEPSLVVLLQSRPGQFTDAEIKALRFRWPVARFVSVAGSWCEGEPRSGFAAAGVYRIAWHAAADRLAAEIGEPIARPGGVGRPICRGLFDLPATATIDERLLVNSTPRAASPAVLAVAARRSSWAEPWVDALAAAGHAAVFWPLDGGALVRGIDAVVWDTFGCEGRLAEFRHALPNESADTPIVAVADFPRPQDLEQMATLGVRRVLGKPLMIADLLTCLNDALHAARASQDTRIAVA